MNVETTHELSVSVTTDHKWHPFKYRNEVPEGELKNHFSHLNSEYIDGFFKYHDYWYHLSDFSRIDPMSALHEARWMGYAPDSLYSGIVIRIDNTGEHYMVGRYMA